MEKEKNKFFFKHQSKGLLISTILKIFLSIIVLVIIVHFLRNLIIFKKIDYKVGKYSNAKHYVISKITYDQAGTSVEEIRRNDNDLKISMSYFSFLNKEVILDDEYYALNKSEYYIFDNLNNEYNKSETSEKIDEYYENINDYIKIFDYSNIRLLLKNSMFAKVKNIEQNGNKCYLITNFENGENQINNSYAYIQKDTGLIIKCSGEHIQIENNKYYDNSIEYRYDLDTNESIKLPNIENYEINN